MRAEGEQGTDGSEGEEEEGGLGRVWAGSDREREGQVRSEGQEGGRVQGRIGHRGREGMVRENPRIQG